MIEYKVKDIDTGLFYTGGRIGSFTKRGTYYSHEGTAKSIKTRMSSRSRYRLKIVAFKIEEVDYEG